MSTSLNIKMKDALGKELSQAITYVDNNSTNSDLKGFAQGIVSLTTNTLTGINKITKTDIDGTYYPITIVSANKTEDNITPTKVDDTHWTISHTGLTAAEEGFNTCSFSFKVDGSNANLDGKTISYIKITTWSSQIAFVSTYISEGSSSELIYKLGIAIVVSTDNQDTDYVGTKFDFIIEPSQTTQGKVTEALNVHFEIV